jgi:branched-chain amino acid transport system substrate-binding protein
MRKSTFVAVAAILAPASTCVSHAQEKISDGVVKIGLIEDMSSLYSDITGMGAVIAAKMAVEDFGGKVLGRPIEVVAADHQNKADSAAATARAWFDTQHVDALMDVAASATALAAIEIAKSSNKIIIINGGRRRALPTKRARAYRSTTRTILTRCRTAPEPPWSKRATTPGTS